MLKCSACNLVYPIEGEIPVFFKQEIKQEELRERDFWEKSYTADEKGAFRTCADRSYEEVITACSFPVGGFGLEFGCGSGAFSEFIVGSSVVGLDISLKLLAKASSLIPVQGSGENLPFRSGLFDFVLAAAALHHIPDPEKAVFEIARVLKPGGYLCVLEANTRHLQRKLIASRRSKWRRVVVSTHFSPEEELIPETRLRDMLRKSGFSIEEMRYLSLSYRQPSILGRMQRIASRIAGRGVLKQYVESYLLIKAANSKLP